MLQFNMNLANEAVRPKNIPSNETHVPSSRDPRRMSANTRDATIQRWMAEATGEALDTASDKVKDDAKGEYLIFCVHKEELSRMCTLLF